MATFFYTVSSVINTISRDTQVGMPSYTIMEFIFPAKFTMALPHKQKEAMQ